MQNSIAGSRVTGALFQDSTAGALAGISTLSLADPTIVVFTHKMTAGTTSSTTFKARGGSDNGGTTTFNGASSGRKLGGVTASSITIQEIKA